MTLSPLPDLLTRAAAVAAETNRVVYVYMIWAGVHQGAWIAGPFMPAEDPFLAVYPSGRMVPWCEHCSDSKIMNTVAAMDGELP